MHQKHTTPRVCDVCGNLFAADAYAVRKGHGRFCSRACACSHQNMGRRRPITERFWAKVCKPPDPDGCWEWAAGTYPEGYGKFDHQRAHRIAWELTRGPIPEGLYVCHNCPDGDNPRCVNPRHLWLGTHRDNMVDMARKGRSTRGKPRRR